MSAIESRGLFGRNEEFGRLVRFFDGAADRSSSMVLVGDAGIGKTSLLRAGLDEARDRGFRVLEARPTEAERGFSFAGLGDIFEGQREEIGGLPEPQRRALRIALLLEEPTGEPPEERAIAVASLELLRRLAGQGPLVLAVDDLQWLDGPSANVVRFVRRRLAHEPIALVATFRASERGSEPDLGYDEQIEVGPLPVDAVRRLLRGRLGDTLFMPAMRQLEAASGGNPFFALELAAEVVRSGGALELGAPMPLSGRLRKLIRDRLSTLAPGPRRAALVTAALAQPTVSIVTQACGGDADAISGALAAGVLVRDGEALRLGHPLLASTLYGETTAVERRALHRLLSKLVETPEQRARHLAETAAGPDSGIASALETAAADPASRGAPDAAVALIKHAIELTPSHERAALHRRRLGLARYTLASGNPIVAETLLEQQLGEAEPGRQRAEIELELGRSRVSTRGTSAARDHFYRALAELDHSSDERILCTNALLEIAESEVMDLHVVSNAHASALVLAEEIGNPELLARALGLHGSSLAYLGEPATEEYWQRAIAIEKETGARHYAGPSFIYALELYQRGDVDAARTLTAEIEESMRAQGDPSLAIVLLQLEGFARTQGAWDEASRYADSASEQCSLTGREWLIPECRVAEARLAMLRGDFTAARETATDALVLLTQETSTGATRSPDLFIEGLANSVLGRVSLYSDQPAEAHESFQKSISIIMQLDLRETAVEVLCEDVAALVACGRVDDAWEALREAEALTAPPVPPLLEGPICRARARVIAAEGKFDDAIAELEHAMKIFDALPSPVPYETGRTLLFLGTVLRRQRRLRDARTALQRALDLFENLGASYWVDKTQTELRRLGGKPAANGALTVTETRVAEAVAAGHSNEEVATQLFMSRKTVEWNLSKIYRKLHVRSRTELAAKLARKP